MALRSFTLFLVFAEKDDAMDATVRTEQLFLALVRNILYSVALVQTVYSREVKLTPTPCSTDKNSSVRSNCTTNPCPCVNNSECVPPYYCPAGCKPSHRRSFTSGTCPRLNKGMERSKRASNPRHLTTLYRFVPDAKCLMQGSLQGALVKQWNIQTNVTIVVAKVSVVFDVPPSEYERFFVTYSDKSYSKVSFKAPLRHARMGAAKTVENKPESLTFADHLLIDSVSLAGINMCPITVVAAVLVYGQPVCPYGRWGVHCNNWCRCPCEIKECHPATGNCWARSFACASGKFGPSCHDSCSELCGGSPRECHLTSGQCKSCDNASYTGQQCERLLTEEELKNREENCRNLPRIMRLDEEMEEHPQPATPESLKMDRYVRSSYSLSLIIATVVVILTFFVACVVYVMLIRHCASQRLKKLKLATDERDRKISLMSYSELRKEYAERFHEPMQNGDIHTETANNDQAQNPDTAEEKPLEYTRKKSLVFSWTNPVISVLKDVPENKGIMPGFSHID